MNKVLATVSGSTVGMMVDHTALITNLIGGLIVYLVCRQIDKYDKRKNMK